MRRLTVEELRNRVELVKKYMELEQSFYNLDQGIVQIQKATGLGLRKESVSKDGYKYYALRDAETKKTFTVYVHHIIMILADADEYIKQMSQGMTINHINGNKADNRLSNLEYCTQSQNNIHAYITGLKEEKPLEKSLNEAQVYSILRAYYMDYKKPVEIAKRYGLTLSAVKKIVKGRLHRPIYKMFMAINKDNIRKSKQGASKLTDADVKEILELYYNQQRTQIEIAKLYNVSRSAVGMIITGQRWKEVYEKFIQQGA
ncbi:sigma factor-like helix-turn-helix DNA-binding protein [Thermaerobacillus caldiproteolyticus]|uniref:sigma factor-like helix-turn-helix DNA-binding protein n=1 Tax=Thermaerobacillus caldiproteolyticus TaxID=247480 RepID=UPI001889EBB1|nr:sigma factor-like helix-turn-helix DNA-binding protein [Anoxybacillus caldiproteolyticus]QPA30049.1 HNH endonuclease [Anoxybacillus caldiproteolyticus]